MSEHDEAAAVAFRCDPRGEIREILRDDVGLPRRVQVGKPFMAAIAESQLMDVMMALRALREQSELTDLVFRVRREDDDDIELHFAARRTDDGELLVVGASSHDLLERVEAELGAPGDDGTAGARGDSSAGAAADAADAADAAAELSALCRGLSGRRHELRRLRGEVADCLSGSSRELSRLVELLRREPGPWSDALRADVLDALDAAASLFRDVGRDERDG